MFSRKNAIMFLFVLLISSLILVACGDSEEGNTDEGFKITVVYLGTDYEVDVLKLDTVAVEETQMVPVTSILAATEAGADWATMYYDFESADGFNPRTKYTCDETIPVFGDKIAQAYVDPVSHRLNWDEALGFPGCSKVTDLAKIIVNDNPDDGAIDGDTDGDEDGDTDGDAEVPAEFKMTVTYNGNDNEVDVLALETEDLDGVTIVTLESIIIASGIVTEQQVEDGDHAYMSFGFIAADGYIPAEKDSCKHFAPLPGWQLAEGYININEQRLYWRDDSTVGSCMGVKDIATITADDSYVLTVNYNDTLARVVVADMTTVDFDGNQVVALDSFVNADGMVSSLEQQTYDFIATDGFMPSSKDNCKDFLPVDMATLAKGYLNPTDHNVYWDADLNMPGCAGVKGLGSIVIQSAE